MGLVVCLVAGLLPLLLAIVATGAPKTATLTLWHERRILEPPAGDDGNGYRGHVPSREVRERIPEQVDVRALPRAVHLAAAMCRIAFCLAVTSLVPVALLVLFSPLLGLAVGVGGLALACGQVGARRGLFSGSAHGAKRAFAVGMWTFVHQIAVIGVIVFASASGCARDPSLGLHGEAEVALAMFALSGGGPYVLGYVGASLGLAAALVHASRSLVAWRALHAAV